MTVTITAVNDAPVLGAIANQALTEDTAATVTLTVSEDC